MSTTKKQKISQEEIQRQEEEYIPTPCSPSYAPGSPYIPDVTYTEEEKKIRSLEKELKQLKEKLKHIQDFVEYTQTEGLYDPKACKSIIDIINN